MAFFNSTIAALLAGQTVSAALLVKFDFLSGTMRLWQGFGDLVAGAQTWNGIGQLGSISGIESAIGDAAPKITFMLSGVDGGLVFEALSNSKEVKFRPVTIFLQFFDSSMQAMDSPYAIYLGIMDVMKIKVDGPKTRIIELTSESIFTRRGIPPWGYLSSASQRGLYPGDAGLDMIQQMASVSTGWPWL